MTSTHLLRTAQAAQQPDWHSLDLLRNVLRELTSRPALVDAGSCDDLREQMARAERGSAFILQAGECAEMFRDAHPASTRSKADQMEDLAAAVTDERGRPAVLVGRIAGQYSKPRSCTAEVLPDGSTVPVYRGDAVNGIEPVPSARQADPGRLLDAYDCSATVLDTLAERPLVGAQPVYASHEALLLEYEEALVRESPSGAMYGTSGHLLWVGDRTRQTDHAHIQFLRRIANPVAVKIGPTIAPGDATDIAAILNPHGDPGRLTFITRMGATRIRPDLGRVLDELGAAARHVSWMVDPMHGNTIVNRSAQKTRVIADMIDEINGAAETLGSHGCHVAGLHLEISPDDVTECVATHSELAATPNLSDYRSTCDPRLSPKQALDVVRHAARQT